MRDGAPAGEFLFTEFVPSGACTRWFTGSPSFKKCQYGIVTDDAGLQGISIDAAVQQVRDYYPGIPGSIIDRSITAILLTLAKENIPAGTVMRVYSNDLGAKLQYLHNDDRIIPLWTGPITDLGNKE